MLSKKVKKGLKNPNLVLLKVWQKLSRYIHDDKLYLSVSFYLSHLKPMHWKNPKTFNEKLTWLKLWTKQNDFSNLVDKYEVRKFISETLGDEFLIPVLGVWDSVDEIDFSELPEKYVLKTTHDSGGVVVVKDGLTDEDKNFLRRHLESNYFLKGREYPYKNVKPRIIAEKFVTDESGWDLKDYKIFCFNGRPEILFLASERFKNKNEKAKFDYFDMNLTRLPIKSFGHGSTFKEGEKHPEIPNFEEMLGLARKISKGFPFVRIDFYNVSGKIYFGEVTFFHDDGLVPIYPKEWDLKLGEMIELPKV